MNLKTGDSIEAPQTGAWGRLPKECAVHRWAKDLARAREEAFCPQTWAIVGHGVLLEHADEDDIWSLMPQIAREAGMSLHHIEPEDVIAEYPTWSAAIPAMAPTLVYLAPGRWLESRSHGDASEYPDQPLIDLDVACQFRKTLANTMQTELSARPVVFVTTARCFSHMDETLRRRGRFDRRIRMPELTNEVIGALFIGEIGESHFDASIRDQPSRIGAILRHDCEGQRRRTLLEQALKRRAWREKRTLQLSDVLEFAINGTADEDAMRVTPCERHATAIHEAGHAVVCWLGARETTPPAYCSVAARRGHLGVMVPPYESHERSSKSACYADAIHQIQVSLAGRAAEHLILGVDRVTAGGSQQDLQRATDVANDLFAANGHSPLICTSHEAASNLAIFTGKASPSQSARIEALSREFLQTQFMQVLSMLQANRELLITIADALVVKGVLFQDDFEALLPK